MAVNCPSCGAEQPPPKRGRPKGTPAKSFKLSRPFSFYEWLRVAKPGAVYWHEGEQSSVVGMALAEGRTVTSARFVAVHPTTLEVLPLIRVEVLE